MVTPAKTSFHWEKALSLSRQAVLKMGFCELPNELMAIHVAGGEAVLRRHKAQCGSQIPS